MKRCCINCKYYRDGYCIYRKIHVNDDDTCHYHEFPKEIPLTPNGELRLATAVTKRHLIPFIKRKRGRTDPLLKRLREILRLPPGYHLIKSRATRGSPLYGAIHIKDAKSGRIIRTLYPKDIQNILQSGNEVK